MKLFADLFTALEETTKTNVKVAALVDYFQAAPPEDGIWTVSFLIGRKPRQIVPTRKLKQWAAEIAGIPTEKVLYNIHKFGNTTAATIPLLLAEFTDNGTIKRGDLLVMVAFGSGFTWGSVILRY